MKLMIVGATSAIAHEAARFFAADGADLFLVGRNAEKLAVVQQDLTVRGAASAAVYTLDVTDTGQHEALIDAAYEALGGLDAALFAYGTLPDQGAIQDDVAATLDALNVNALSVIALLTRLAGRFEQQRHGCLAVISSVAGDRGRASNYIYGTAKGALTIFTSGLRNRLAKAGVSVVTIKPGFVDTPMTAHIRKSPLFAKPGAVGKRVYEAMLKGQDVVYTPWFWRFVMLLIRLVPERIFKKLSL
jgi:short-subunit dehydrogenase